MGEWQGREREDMWERRKEEKAEEEVRGDRIGEKVSE